MDNSPNSQSQPSIFSSLGALSFPKPAQSTDPSSSSLHPGRTGPFSMLTNQRITPSSNTSLSSILHSKSQDAFRSAALSRPHVSALRDLGIQMNSRRRAVQQPKVGLATGYIDQDDSGNYDPVAEGAKKRARRKVALPVTPPPKKVRQEGDEHRGKWAKRIPVGYSFPISFYFKKEKSLAFLRSITPGPYSSPSSSASDTDSNSEDSEDEEGYDMRRKIRRPKRYGEVNTRADGLTLEDLTIGHPQRRGCQECFNQGDDECSLINRADSYPCTACEDTGIDCTYVIQPELKRSCERCRQKRISCSYKIDGGEGVDACDECDEAGFECFAGPLKAVVSSKRYDDVLKVKGKRRQKVKPIEASESEEEKVKSLERRFIACKHCLDGSLRCSLRRSQEGPCRECKKVGRECKVMISSPTYEGLPLGLGRSLAKQKKTIASQKTDRGAQSLKHSKAESPGSLGERLGLEYLGSSYSRKIEKRRVQTLYDPNGRPYSNKALREFAKARPRPLCPSRIIGTTGGIQHIRIQTPFAHPIKFNYMPPPISKDDDEICDWCKNQEFFGLHGHGVITAEVIPWNDGSGYEEIGERYVSQDGEVTDYRGHNQRGEPITKMCIGCTSKRLSIMSCGWHEFTVLEDQDPMIYDRKLWAQAWHAAARGDMQDAGLILNTKWCSICSTAADYRCCTPQDVMVGMRDELEVSGCGLLLCENCHYLINKIEEQKRFEPGLVVLDRLVGMVATDQFHYEDGARADAVFLTTGGELNIRLEKDFGQDGNAKAINPGREGTEQRAIELSDDEDEVFEPGVEMRLILERIGKGKGVWMENCRKDKLNGKGIGKGRKG